MSSQERLAQIFWGGVVIAVLAGSMVGFGWPRMETPSACVGWVDDCSPKPAGNIGILIFGLLLGGIGQIMLLVGCVGYGVKLGTESVRTRTPAS